MEREGDLFSDLSDEEDKPSSGMADLLQESLQRFEAAVSQAFLNDEDDSIIEAMVQILDILNEKVRNSTSDLTISEKRILKLLKRLGIAEMNVDREKRQRKLALQKAGELESRLRIEQSLAGSNHRKWEKQQTWEKRAHRILSNTLDCFDQMIRKLQDAIEDNE